MLLFVEIERTVKNEFIRLHTGYNVPYCILYYSSEANRFTCNKIDTL